MGIRNGPPYPIEENDSSTNKNTFTPEQKKMIRNILIGIGITGLVAAGIYLGYRYNCINKISALPSSFSPSILKSKSAIIMKQEIDDTAKILDKGTEIHKMVNSEDFALDATNGAIHTSYDKLDRIAYKYGLQDFAKTGKRYDAKFISKNKLVGPANKDKAEAIFNELLDNDPTYKQDLEGTASNFLFKLYKTRMKSTSDSEIMKIAEKQAKEQIANDSFRMAMMTVAEKSNSSQKFIDQYMSKGYNFIEDYTDKGSMANNPIILLNAKNDMIEEGKTFVNNSNININNIKLAESILAKNNHPGQYTLKNKLDELLYE